MQAEFWHQAWKTRQIAFHLPKANPGLTHNIKHFQLANNSAVFIPLCGKTLDIGWLLPQGYQVVGCELSQQAVDELFAELEITPLIETVGPFKRYSYANLTIWVGDIFQLTPKLVGKVDLIYDRAALVALPEEMRLRYVEQLIHISNNAPQLLLSFEYNQQLMPGPPFAIGAKDIYHLYQQHYRISLLQHKPVKGGLKGEVEADEGIWQLLPL